MPLGSFDFSASAAKKRKSDAADSSRGGGGGAPSGNSRKQLDNLDHRLRTLEALAMETYRVPKDVVEKTPLWKNLTTAKLAWANEKPESKGQHKWGPERWTLAIGFLKDLDGKSADQLNVLLGPVLQGVQAHDEVARAMNGTTVVAQLQGLEAWCKKVPDSDMGRCSVDDWIGHFQWTETKKRDAYLLRIGLRHNTALSGVFPALRYYIQAHGGTYLAGTAPSGPLFHNRRA